MAGPEVAVVCPFFNESGVIEPAVRGLLAHLDASGHDFEVVLVDDGSTDGCSAELSALLADARLRVVSYPRNRGRGFALRTGMAATSAPIVCTTEADGSWGYDTLDRMIDVLRSDESVDFVVASPNLPGGGYVNVAWSRVWASRIGNWLIRSAIGSPATMNTGMTRAYRSDVIKTLPLEEDRKEFHLEVLLKALALDCRFREVPAMLTWTNARRSRGRLGKRFATLTHLVNSHLRWIVFAHPLRYLVPASLALFAVAAVTALVAVVRWLVVGPPIVFWATFAGVSAILAMQVLMFATVSAQLRALAVSNWRAAQAALRASMTSSPVGECDVLPVGPSEPPH